MISTIRTLETGGILTWLERTIRPALTKDISNYAKGRLRCWIGVEPSLSSPTKLFQGFEAPKALTRLEELIEWKFDYCLATYSGDEEPIGISAHRDASYANYEAYSLNITGEAQFDYWEERESFGYSKAVRILAPESEPTDSLILTGGKLFHFNCKNRHAATPGPKRWSLNFWRAKEQA
jgi:hypothetical protein